MRLKPQRSSAAPQARSSELIEALSRSKALRRIAKDVGRRMGYEGEELESFTSKAR